MRIFHPSKITNLFPEKPFATIIIFLAILVPALMKCQTAAAAIRPVAMENDSAPGFDSGATFYSFNASRFSINNAGQTAFNGGVQSGSDRYYTLWREDAGTLTLMHKQGDSPPGVSGDVAFQTFYTPNINDSGMVAFVAFLEGNDVQNPENSTGVWKGSPGSVSLVARAGDMAPGNSGDTFGKYFSVWANDTVLLNGSGKVAFNNNLNQSSSNNGIFQETTSGLTLIAKQGGAAHGISDATYTQIPTRPALNDRGDLSFEAFVSCNSGFCLDWVDNLTGAGIIYLADNGNVSTKYKSYTSAPGVTGGEFYFIGTIPHDINEFGKIAFEAAVTGDNIDTSNNRGIWSDASGALSLIARTGSQAPGASAGAVFDGFQPVVMNSSGQVAFAASLKTGAGGVDAFNDTGIWYGGPGNLELIAREGDPVDGRENGIALMSFANYTINDSGQVAFIGAANSPSIGLMGIWLYDPSNGLSTVVVEGDEVTLTTGETVTFDSIYHSPAGSGHFPGSGDGRARFFNNAGEIVFGAMLSDYREGIFIANTSGSTPATNLTAEAGANQSVTEGNTVTLDASGSTATASTITAYSWAQTDSSGVTVSLSDNSAINPTFTAPMVDASTTLVFTLTVTSNIGATDTDTVSITISDASGGGTGDDDDDDDDDDSSSGCFISNIQNKPVY